MVKQNSPIPTLSLFSGAGGLDLGFMKAGFDIRACVEIEAAYVKTLRQNAGNNFAFQEATEILCQDIREFDVDPFVGTGIDCVIGGPPCQTFSAAGRRSGGVIGVNDERGQLFKAYCGILDKLEPKAFVFENVYGLPGANGGEPWREIVQSFADVGYELFAEVVDTADYGVPQHRERLIMVGLRAGIFEFPMPTYGPDSVGNKRLVSVEEAIHDLQDDSEPFQNGLGGMYGHLLPEVPEGLNYSYFTEEMGHPEPVFAWRSKFHDLLYKVKRDEPCRTIKAQPGKFTGPFHWKNRHFTIDELKRLQTFPDSYEIVGSYAKVMEQIGNSVPPRLAFVIASSLREQVFAETAKRQFELRPAGFKSTFRQRQRQRSKRFKEIAKAANSGRLAPAKPIGPLVGSESYVLNPKDMFDRVRHSIDSVLDSSLPTYDVRVSEDKGHLDIQFTKRLGASSRSSKIDISGLQKYLKDWSSLTAFAQIDNLYDVFVLWGVIEEALIKRSRFFTLIDIYGHYANKGDDVSIASNWCLDIPEDQLNLLNFFSDTTDCGSFVEKEQLQSHLRNNLDEISDAIIALRKHRFDVRTALTHPIIGEGRVLCTYPFPLLSPRALVESRVNFLQDEQAGFLENAS